MIKEQTRVTMTTTKTNYVSSATGSRAKTKTTKTSTKKKKEQVQMKWVQILLHGVKVGKPFKMPATQAEDDDIDYYAPHFEKIMREIPKTSAFWVSENDDVEVKEWLVLHPSKRTDILNCNKKHTLNHV